MTRTRLRRGARALAASATVLLMTVGSGGMSASAAVVPAGAEAVVRYTEHGIPHILAEDYTGLGYGYGYASAKDNLCALSDVYMTLRAERSRHLGPDAPPNEGLASVDNSLDSDLYYQGVNDSGVVEKVSGQQPPLGPKPEIVEMVRGYVGGFNRYLEETGADGITDPACAGAAWVRPISELDVYRHVYDVSTSSGLGRLAGDIVNAQPPGTRGRSADVPHDVGAVLKGLGAGDGVRPKASNAIAAGKDATRSGQSVLLGNPHYPWHGPNRFWQAHLTIPGELNVSGASLLGIPSVLIGHNDEIAWSHTVSTAATMGLYEVPLVPGEPTAYQVDGKREEMTGRTVRVEVRNTDGGTDTVERTLWSTRYGPVIAGAGGSPLPWETTAHAVRDPNVTNLRTLNTWLDFGTAESTADMSRALADNQSLPWLNTIAADRRGDVLYSDVQVAPHVTDELAEKCSTPLGAQIFALSGISVLDGGRGDCAWGSDEDAVQPGIFGPGALPEMVRRDYVLNANDSPWLTNLEQPLVDYPRTIGDVGTERSARTREAIESVRERLAGEDGLPGEGFSHETMKDMLFADRSRVAVLAAADTADMCESFPGGRAPSSSGSVDVSAACDAVAKWDHTYRLDSRGSLLFERFVRALGSVEGGPWQVGFDPADPVHTPNTLKTGDPAVHRAFGDAAVELRNAGIPLDAPLGDHQQVTRNGAEIGIHGGPGELGVLNVITPEWDPGQGNTEVAHGSSFVQVVEFGSAGSPKASTLMTYSQSTDPTSPHYADQTELYSAGQWVTDRFSEQEIANSPELRVELLGR